MKKWSSLYGFIALLLIWSMASMMTTRHLVPKPMTVGLYMVSHASILIKHLLVSFYRIFIAIVLTLFAGGLMGLLTARQKWADTLFSPLIYAAYPIPKIAFLPLIMLFFGLGDASKIFLVALILFFQITLSVRDGVKQMPQGYFLTIKLWHPSFWQLYRHILLPALLPQLFTALRVSIGTSISVLFFAENFATQYGIGYFIMDSWLKLDYVGMFAGIVAISLMGFSMFAILDALEKRLCPWRFS